MKRFALSLVLLFAGCGTLHEKYVKQDRSNYSTLAPRVRVMMKFTKQYDGSQVEDMEDRLQLWDARLTQAEATFK